MTDRESFEKEFNPSGAGLMFGTTSYIPISLSNGWQDANRFNLAWLAWKAATLAERERCALILSNSIKGWRAEAVANEIRGE